MLINVESANGYLEATESGGYAVSEPIVGEMTRVNPLMTSNTSDGVASASYEHDSRFLAYKAFDGDDTSYWLSVIASGDWIQYESVNPMNIDKYTLSARSNSPAEMAKGWNILASDNGIDWTIVDTQSNQIFGQGVTKEYIMPQRVTTKFIRFEVTVAGFPDQCNMAEWVMYKTTQYSQIEDIQGKFEFNNISESTEADLLKTSEPIANGDNLVIVKNDNSIHEVVASNVIGSPVITKPVSAMTKSVITPDVTNTPSTSSMFIQEDIIFAISEYYARIEARRLNNGSIVGMTTLPTLNGIPTNNSTGLCFSRDGLNMYFCVSDFPDNTIYRYTLSESLNVATATLHSTGTLVGADIAYHGGAFLTDDGTKLFTFGRTGTTKSFKMFTLSTPFDITTASLTDTYLHNVVTLYGGSMLRDGSKIICVYYNQAYEYTMTTPFDITTCYLSSSKGGLGSNVWALTVSEDGKLMVPDNHGYNQLEEFTLSGDESLKRYSNFEMDTTSITQGEAPTKAFRVDESVEFNGVLANTLSNNYGHSNTLTTTRTLTDISIPSNSTLETTVNLSATGNKMIELLANIVK